MAKLNLKNGEYTLNGIPFTGIAFSSHLSESRENAHNSHGWDGHTVGTFTSLEEVRDRASKYSETDTLYIEEMEIVDGLMTKYEIIEKY